MVSPLLGEVAKVALGPVQGAGVGATEDVQRHLPVLAVYALHGAAAALLHPLGGGAGDPIVLLVDLHRLHLVAADVVEGDAPQDVVEEDLAEEVFVEQLPDLQHPHPLGVDAPVVEVALVGQQGLRLGDGHGAGEVVALAVLAADLQQESRLFGGLHPLGHHPQPHQPRHPDNGFQDARALARALLAHLQKLHVDLEDVHIHVLEHVQGGVARAEVVHQHGEARLPQSGHRLGDDVKLLGVGALGDLDGDEVGVQPVALDELLKAGRHVHGVEVHPGDVDRDRHRPKAPVEPLPHLGADPLPAGAVQVGDKAVFLHQG